MRLLNAHKLDLVEISEGSAPRYAILSHTWGEEEVTLQDIQVLMRKQWSRALSQTASAIKAKKGYIKIQRAAEVAIEYGFDYIWVDTCCIDKTSSAELSEAINSMYRWYNKAAVCYAYMEDVKSGIPTSEVTLFHSLCQASRWFTRGWTLQELIAPEDVMFHDGDWGYLGSKAQDEDVRASLARITGIDVRVLGGLVQPSEMSIAAKMKWASHRETTRVEDMAYCLMGLFDVNMPLLYGEGKKAFIRLQEEILKGSNDHTIFTWRTHKTGSMEDLSGLLAETPQDFADVDIYRPMPPSVSQGSIAWSTTSQGLRLSLFLQPSLDWKDDEIHDEYDAVLECAVRRGDQTYKSPAIRMRRLYGDQFARVEPHLVKRVNSPSFDSSNGGGSYEVIFVKQKPFYAIPDFVVSLDNILSPGIQVWPTKYWDEESATLRAVPSYSNRGAVGIFRFYIPTMATTVDLAVGLTRKSGGTWAVWHLQRLSAGEAIHQTVASVTGWMNRSQASARDTTSTLVRPDFRKNPWKDGTAEYISIDIQETKLYGRTLFGTVSEYDSAGDDMRYTEASSSLHELLEDFIVPMTLQRSLANKCDGSKVHPAESLMELLEIPMKPPSENDGISNNRMHRVRLRWLQDPTWNLKDQEVKGFQPGDTMLLQACKGGLIEIVEDVLHRDLDCLTHCLCGPGSSSDASKDFEGFHPIHWAVVGGHVEIIRTLLYLGADYHSETKQGWSCIHLAAMFGRFIVLRWLIDYEIKQWGSSIEDILHLEDSSNSGSEGPLHLAISHISMTTRAESLALADMLEKLDGSPIWLSKNHAGETPLHRLAASGPAGAALRDVLIVEKLLSYERRFNFFGEHVDKAGRTVLWHAVCAGSAYEVEHLIKDGRTTLSKPDKMGMTPLHAACRLGYAHVARVLLKAGAAQDSTTKGMGLTAAHFAALFDHPECLEELIAFGADVHKSAELIEPSFRPIHLAAANSHSKCLSILQNAGGNLEWACLAYIIRVPGETPHFRVGGRDLTRCWGFDLGTEKLFTETPMHQSLTTRHSPALRMTSNITR
ncbi:hypothetical protein F4778DRAFT_773615 [Xylariomycetidae sp. FL2044]|nr:hypothetical protein F4778DRAFT_773615 [Xylariomycetidae sp. FL2044]